MIISIWYVLEISFIILISNKLKINVIVFSLFFLKIEFNLIIKLLY